MNLVGEVEKNEAIRKMRLGVKMRDWEAVLRTMRRLPPDAELWRAKMNKCDQKDVLEILSARNQWGNNPLHCAASTGSFFLCERIVGVLSTAEQISRPVMERNNEGETPVFLAAVHGHWEVFLLLNLFVELEHATTAYVKSNGDSVLHLTIQRKYFEKKRRHVFGSRIMKQLLDNDAFYDSLMERDLLGMDDDHPANLAMLRPSHKASSFLGWTPLLRATKYGAIEMVWAILEKKPFAIEDESDEKKNVMLVAVEERQSTLLMQFRKKPHIWNRKLHQATDVHGNTALHLVAKLSRHRNIPMSAIHLQWEVHWFEYVKKMMPPEFNERQNKEGKTPGMVFAEEHHDLVKKSNEWVKEMSGNHIVAATLISSVTFATCYQVPGGYDGGNGRPIVGNRSEFHMFAITALVSFCSSVTSLAAFLAIYSSQSDRPRHYRRRLPLTLCLGLFSMFLSVVSMLISFCAAHTFELVGPINKSSEYVPLYVGLTLIPLCFYGATQIPLYWRLLRASVSPVPLSRPFYVEQLEETPPDEEEKNKKKNEDAEASEE
ncbi:uncharacterized protein LOC114746128 [Neltuma alba]|uniref:uncharacterized protein LOC114746128 n=1 Tax=Neltuma alba TaxID=207710 RepID=UPI0010A3596F|nr:uncharacterized protein LOC114746128 [Prosopis alba]